jgi:hypothetical protein
MLAVAVRLALITGALLLLAPPFTTSADAQNVHRRCTKVKDKMHCSCIFANGGQVRFVPGSGRRRAFFTTLGEYDAYARCMRRNGRFS